MARRSLLDLFFRLGSRGYDWMYRRGAPWESGPRSELVELVESGRITPGRAIDLGCGAGADTVFLAGHGFDVIGVDLSPVAVRRARELATSVGGGSLRFVEADLLELRAAGITGPFDLLFDGGTLDDFPPARRPSLARVITELAGPTSVFVMWCFYAADRDLPRFSVSGPSRWGAPAIEPGEEDALFGEDWTIERLATPPPGSGAACFLMTRRGEA
jgi:SAM-dependent methyltransferase